MDYTAHYKLLDYSFNSRSITHVEGIFTFLRKGTKTI